MLPLPGRPVHLSPPRPAGGGRGSQVVRGAPGGGEGSRGGKRKAAGPSPSCRPPGGPSARGLGSIKTSQGSLGKGPAALFPNLHQWSPVYPASERARVREGDQPATRSLDATISSFIQPLEPNRLGVANRVVEHGPERHGRGLSCPGPGRWQVQGGLGVRPRPRICLAQGGVAPAQAQPGQGFNPCHTLRQGVGAGSPGAGPSHTVPAAPWTGYPGTRLLPRTAS